MRRRSSSRGAARRTGPKEAATLFLFLACTDPDDAGDKPQDSLPADSSGITDSTVTDSSEGPKTTLDIGDQRGRSLIIVQSDSLRADHLPPYGSANNTLPTSLDIGWLVVDNHYRTGAWTGTASASGLLGLEPMRHGILYPGDNATAEAISFSEVLSNAGYATALFSGNNWVGPNTSLDQGFDTAEIILSDVFTSNMGDLTTAALAWMAEIPPEQPVMIFLQPMDTHTPFSPLLEDRGTFVDSSLLPFSYNISAEDQEALALEAILAADSERATEITEALNGAYDEQILDLDRMMVALLDGLEAAGRGDAMVVLTGDHGETLNDAQDGVVGHGNTVRQELLHVPLMIHQTDLAPGTVDCLSMDVDFFPTFLFAAELVGLEGIDGAPLQEGCRDTVRASVFNPAGQPHFAGARDERYKVVRDCTNGTEAAYDMSTDVQEIVPLDPSIVTDRETLEDSLDELMGELEVLLGETMNCPRR